jgi:hypothetical protein
MQAFASVLQVLPPSISQWMSLAAPSLDYSSSLQRLPLEFYVRSGDVSNVCLCTATTLVEGSVQRRLLTRNMKCFLMPSKLFNDML